ncbi:MAG: HlyC/CorC family transporter [Brucellaceae bacterium]|nr:HlyC/CorC family transporter [Brucellaceae bacterium]
MADPQNNPVPAPGSERSDSAAPETDPSRSPAESGPVGKPPLLSRLSVLFKGRNGADLRENLADALDAGGEVHADAFSPEERAMLRNILRLREVRVEDVMVERADIEAIDRETTLGELLNLFEQSGHSRMPVFGENLDDPRGMVHIRDVVGYITRTARPKAKRTSRKQDAAAAGASETPKYDLSSVDLNVTVEDAGLVRPVLFVPISMLAGDLMAKMQAARTQMALVIDEYGGTDGLVSLEDIVEMVVGDIEDEHDDEEAMIAARDDGSFVVDARTEIDEVTEAIGEHFQAGEYGEDADSIGGLIFAALGRVPARGEVVQAVPGFEFDILDADPRRIRRVRIRPTKSAERRRRQTAARDAEPENSGT